MCANADHGVVAGQPDAAGRLTPEGLGVDDPAKLPVPRAVAPITATPAHLVWANSLQLFILAIEHTVLLVQCVDTSVRKLFRHPP